MPMDAHRRLAQSVGAWVGTAFLVAECDIPEDQKDQILSGPSEAFVITRSFTGKTARNYRNPVVEAWERSELEPLPMPYQRVLMEDFMECAIRGGRDDLYSNPSGQIGGMLKTRKPAAQIMAELVQGTVDALNGLAVGGGEGPYTRIPCLTPLCVRMWLKSSLAHPLTVCHRQCQHHWQRWKQSTPMRCERRRHVAIFVTMLDGAAIVVLALTP